MRIIFIFLLVMLCACGNNNDKKTPVDSTKQLLTGYWQLDSINLNNADTAELDMVVAYLIDDDHYKNVRFLFGDGRVTEYDENDSLSGPFKWQGDTAIELSDTEPKEVLKIKSINNTQLVLLTGDSVLLYFKRGKQK